MAKFAEKHLFEKILAKRHVDENFSKLDYFFFFFKWNLSL